MPTRPRSRTVTLRDGARVRLRPITAEDKELLAASFERLSERSRYRRFLTTKSKLSRAELAYLVDEVDHSDHEAIMALDPISGAMLGIARYVRSKEDAQTAEVAVTVADDWQRRGLGKALLDRLTYRARQEGISRFSALVLGDNRPALGLFADLGAAESHHHASEVELLIELPPTRGMGAQLARALRAAGAGSLVPARTLAQRVAHGAGPSPPARPGGPIRTVVLGLSEDWAGERTLLLAAELARTLTASLHLVHAYGTEQQRSGAEARLNAAREAAAQAGIEAHAHPRRDEPADAILAAARELDADLLIVGGGGPRRGVGLRAGSIPNRVSHRSPCSVLIVREEGAPHTVQTLADSPSSTVTP
jgi:nucleotide-binding universal stress UspA family protein/GNAT superfamily N-acetyltransferase